MKMSQFLFLFLGSAPFLPLTAQGADQRPIAVVFEIEDRGSILKLADRDQLTDYLGSLLSKGGFQVVPRAQLKERLSSAKKGSYKSCYDQGCQIELGRELAAEKSLASQVLRFGKTCKVTVNLFDLKRATSDGAGTHSGPCKIDALATSLEKATENLLRALGKEGTSSAPIQTGPITEVGERIAAYERGEKEHAFDIGMAYLHGHSGAPQNYVRAKSWFAKAAAHDDFEAFVHLGDLFLYGLGTRKNTKKAFKWYRKSAEADDPLGQEKLADMYHSGLDIRKNLVEAEKWYRKAAEKEQRAKPCEALAAMYMLGDGVKSNQVEALKWYLKAAELGSVSAADAIAMIYQQGRDGLPVDKAKALDWLKTGARGGYEPAMFRLATAYAEGRLSVVDLVEAYAWLAVYIEKEVQTDQAELLQKQLAAKMSSGDLERAIKEAAVKVKKYVTPEDRENKAYMKTLPGR